MKYNTEGSSGAAFTELSDRIVAYRTDGLQTAELFCGDVSAIDEFFSVRDWKTGKAVVVYVLRETVLTTILGIVLGIGVGAGMAYKIIRTLEQGFFRFDRSIKRFFWLLGAVMTVTFTVIVNAAALRKVWDLKLTDAA